MKAIIGILVTLILLLMPVELALVKGVPLYHAANASKIVDNPIPQITFQRTDSKFLVREKSIECMALNIYHEARNLSTAGRLAVEQVTLNRVKSSKFPSSICDVVYRGQHWTATDGSRYPKRDRCHFSWYCDGKNDLPNNKNKYNESLTLAAQVVDGHWPDDITDGAMYYYADYIAAPRWTKGKIRSAVIDVHRFYRYKK